MKSLKMFAIIERTKWGWAIHNTGESAELVLKLEKQPQTRIFPANI